MLRSHPKKNKSVEKWHSRARLIDLKRTRITIIGREAANPAENTYSMDTARNLCIVDTESSTIDYFADNQAIMNEIFGVTVSFVTVDN